MTQTEAILAHLQTGATLTPLEALDRFGCFRLGARIHDLRKAGHDIQMEFVSANSKTFARYRLPQSRGQIDLFGGACIERSSDGVGHRAESHH